MSKISVSREMFIDAFEKAWAELYGDPERREQLERDYDCSSKGQKKRWTAALCGKGTTHLGAVSLVARAFGRMHIGLELLFDHERHKVDAFGRVLPRGTKSHKSHVDGVNVVMVEVENETNRSHEEFWKLTQSRCLLKVLITYGVGSRAFENARKRMQTIYLDCVGVLGKDDPAAYLLVGGCRGRDDRTIEWHYFGMSDAGRLDKEIVSARGGQRPSANS